MEQKILLLEDALSRRLYPRQEKVGCRRPKEEGEDDPLNGYYLADCGKTMGGARTSLVRTSGTTERHPAGSPTRPDFSPAQPWRGENAAGGLQHPPITRGGGIGHSHSSRWDR